jgi:hypothetical protein
MPLVVPTPCGSSTVVKCPACQVKPCVVALLPLPSV